MDILYYINPVEESIIDYLLSLPEDSLGRTSVIRTDDKHLDIPKESVLIVGIPEDRTAQNNPGTGMNLTSVRQEFYKFYRGNWHTPIYDIGDIRAGSTYEETEKILREITIYCVKHNIIPIYIGGSHALTYSLYRSYDHLDTTVNLTVIDSLFDLGDDPAVFHSHSYLHRIILEEPHNLQHYTNLGYQTFANSQNEINLMQQMLFDTYRLGEIKSYLELSEPALRESHIVSIDLSAVRRSDAPGNNNGMVSGFTGDEICSMARYAGLSNQIQVFGIFEYNDRFDRDGITAGLVAQILWYFIEGVNFRIDEYPGKDLKGFKKYHVPVDDEVLIFIKSSRTGRWWMQISSKENNKKTIHTLIPCTYRDYQTAAGGDYPEKWYNSRMKTE